jgi:AraC-like DNA-binding protein
MAAESRHGILNPRAGEAQFTLDRRAPSDDLEAFVERHWSVRWSLRGRAPFAQETLPHPNVNLVIGTHRPGVHGIGTTRFVAELEGNGFVVGVKFRPGGFFPFYGRDVVELRERERSLVAVFGAEGARLEEDVMGAESDDARIALLETFLRAREPKIDPLALLAGRAVDAARADPSLSRARELAEQVGVSVRTLERICRRYVGVGPKWVLRRYRVHEACERIAAGGAPSWSSLALELGYCDQAHFIRDFRSQVGRTPVEYAAACAEGAKSERKGGAQREIEVAGEKKVGPPRTPLPVRRPQALPLLTASERASSSPSTTASPATDGKAASAPPSLAPAAPGSPASPPSPSRRSNTDRSNPRRGY